MLPGVESLLWCLVAPGVRQVWWLLGPLLAQARRRACDPVAIASVVVLCVVVVVWWPLLIVSRCCSNIVWNH